MKGVYIILIAILSPLVALGEKGHHDSKHEHQNHHHHQHHYHNNHQFELPSAVVYTLGDRYDHFDLIHTQRSHRLGQPVYVMILQHHDGFVQTTVGHRGRFYGDTYYDDYPLQNHYCNDYCGFQYQHYENRGFVSYDPYSGCDYHIGLLSRRYPRYVYRPYFGYGSLYYHPRFGHYKRFKRYHSNYGWGYYRHSRPYKYYSHRYHRYGNRGRGYGYYGGYGRHNRGHGRYHKHPKNHNGYKGYKHDHYKGRKHRGDDWDDYDDDWDDDDRYQSKRKRRSHYGSRPSDRSQGRYHQQRRHSHQRYGSRRDHFDDDDDDEVRPDRRKRQSREELDRKRGRERFENPGMNSRQRDRRGL